MGYCVLHRHGEAGPKGRASYIKFGGVFSSKESAKRWAKNNLRGHSLRAYKFVPASKVAKTKYKDLYYIRR